jgi:hypothetical protein
MRAFALTAVITAAVGLAACRAVYPPPHSASAPAPARPALQALQPGAPSVASPPTVAELPPANGPPLNILKPPR